MSDLEDLSQHSLLDLFRLEAENQVAILSAGLLALERQPRDAEHLEACMRAAHSLKGAARIVGLDAAVAIAHAMEDCFVAAQQNRLLLDPDRIDRLLGAVDLLTRIADPPGGPPDRDRSTGPDAIAALLEQLRAVRAGTDLTAPPPAGNAARGGHQATGAASAAAPDAASGMASGAASGTTDASGGAAALPPPTAEAERATPEDPADRVLRVSAANLNRLLALSGEAVVEARWLKSFSAAMLRLKRLQRGAAQALERLEEAQADPDRRAELFVSLHAQLSTCQQVLAEQMMGLEQHDQRTIQVAQRLYDQALASRMRPFTDGVTSLTRVVRDLGRALGKQARLEIAGGETQVDRDILEKLDAPLGHLIRNAIDHGIEEPAARLAAGKPAEGVLTLEARHHAGLLQITLSDDGAGIDIETVRALVVERNLSRPEVAPSLSSAELLEFLFLPGFSLRDTVT